jgi:DNA-binding PadR family transcriptional regulator
VYKERYRYGGEIGVAEEKGEKAEQRERGESCRPAFLQKSRRIPKGILLPPLFMPSILLILKERPDHGYSILKKLADIGVVDPEMDPSPVYKVLRMFEEEGLAESEHESGDKGPARKVYRLTEKGDRTLDFLAARMDKAGEIIAWFQAGYKRLR